MTNLTIKELKDIPDREWIYIETPEQLGNDAQYYNYEGYYQIQGYDITSDYREVLLAKGENGVLRAFKLKYYGITWAARKSEKERPVRIKTYLLKIRQYEILCNDYILKVYKVTTDNVYRIIGKIYSTTLEEIKRIDYSEWTQEREDFWVKEGHKVIEYKERKLSEDLNGECD